MLKFHYLVIQLLIDCLYLLIDIQHGQSGTNYHFNQENEHIKEAYKFIRSKENE